MKEYALAEIFDAVTLPPLSDNQLDAAEIQQDDSSSTALPVAEALEATSSRYRESNDELVVVEQNNETHRKHHKKNTNNNNKGSMRKNPESTEKLLKSLVSEYSKDERAKKNRRGRKSAHLSKEFSVDLLFLANLGRRKLSTMEGLVMLSELVT